MTATGYYNDARTVSPKEAGHYFCRYREKLGRAKYRHGFNVLWYEPGYGWHTGMSTVVVVQWAEINEPA